MILVIHYYCLYVDDLIFTDNNFIVIEDSKKFMLQEFEIIDIGLMSFLMGIKIIQSNDEILSTKRVMLLNF